MTQIHIGSRVVTRKYDSKCCLPCDDKIKSFDGKEGIVTHITSDGMYVVHGLLWPKESVELVSKEWEPEYGKEYEFSNSEETWRKQIFIGINPIENLGFKYITVDVLGRADVWKHCRPVRRTLEDQVRDWVKRCDDKENLVEGLMELFANHQSEFTDEEILEYIDKHYPLLNKNAAIATVRHFTTLKWKG